MSIFRKNRLGRSSIKESLDNLPSGICFARPNGVIVLYNRRMDALARELTGRDLQHLSELQAALAEPNAAVKLVNPEHGVYLFPDNTVWQFTQSNITDETGSAYILIASTDVTELYRKEMELKQENAELEEVNARARALYAQIEQIVRDEESFALQARIHDDLGMMLLKSRQILTGKTSLDEMRLMGVRWAHIAEMLGVRNEEMSHEYAFSPEHELAELTELAQSIGITLRFDGELPNDEQSAKLILSAVRECASNAVKHAKATEMRVTLTNEGGITKAEVKNNGIPPEGSITEGGGLSSLRRQVEKSGGTMLIQSIPRFMLTVRSGQI